MSTSRYDYIDIAKGIGILMVVWAHILISGRSHQMIYAFHMPLFFLLSGMLFQRGKYTSFGTFVKKRTKRLLMPYSIYSVLTWMVWAAFRCVRRDDVDSYLMPLLQTFYAQGSGAYMVHNSALWFVPCLFLVEILYFFLCKLGDWKCLFACFICTAISFGLGSVYGDDYWFLLPWNADAALIALTFYGVGNIMAKHVGHEKIITSASNNWVQHLWVVVVLSIALYWSATSFGECSMGSSSYQCQPWVFVTRAFLGCVWLIGISLLISIVKCRNKITSTVVKYLKWAGMSSLDIMCLHIPAKGLCMILVAAVVGVSVDTVAMSSFLSCVSFFVTMLAVWIVMKLVPVNKLSQTITKR